MFTVAKTHPITGVCEGHDGDNGIINDPSHCLTYRTDTGEPLGVVGINYEILQPAEAEELVSIVTNKPVETRWSGKKMMYTAEISQMDLGNDPVHSHMVLVNSFDGTSSVTTMGTTFRLCCSNQLSMAFRSAKKNDSWFKIRHNGDFQQKLEDLKENLNGIRVQESNWRKTVSPLVNADVNKDWLESLWKKAAPMAMNLTGEYSKAQNEAAKISAYLQYCNDIFDREVEQGCRPSKWLGANAVTNYIQHNLAKRGRKPDMDRRYVDCAIGLRAAKTNKVMATALEMV
jgi:hypothetical protein|tara:strand:- start:1705 stop:2565 length:861 start_codon:yes stop_codon:yes gene_type:complete